MTRTNALQPEPLSESLSLPLWAAIANYHSASRVSSPERHFYLFSTRDRLLAFVAARPLAGWTSFYLCSHHKLCEFLRICQTGDEVGIDLTPDGTSGRRIGVDDLARLTAQLFDCRRRCLEPGRHAANSTLPVAAASAPGPAFAHPAI